MKNEYWKRRGFLTFCGILCLQATTALCEEAALDLTLSQAIETALSNNLNIQLSRQDLEIARGGSDLEHGSFDTLLETGVGAGETRLTPTVQGSALSEDTGYWNTTLSKRMVTGTEFGLSWNNDYYDSDSSYLLIDPLYSSGVDLTISQPLLQGMGNEVQTAGIRAAAKRTEAAIFLVHREAAELCSQVRKAYWELVSSWQDIEALELSLTLARKLEEETRSKIETGVLADVEIYQPQSEVARREQNLIGGERAVGVAEDTLRYLMNNQEWNRPLNPTDRPVVEEKIPSLDTVLERALVNRPDIRAADMEKEAAEIISVAMKDKTLPSLNLFGSVGLGGNEDSYGNAVDRLSNDGDTRWQAGVKFSLPLENRSAEGKYRQAKAQAVRAKIGAELLRQQTRSLARQAVRDVRLSLKAIEATRKTSLSSQKRLEGEQTKFDVGRATTYDVLVAQEAFSRALADEYRAQILYVQVLAELDRIQGIVRIKNTSFVEGKNEKDQF
ncbi:outer membrane protein [Desulfocapsa sulfexigens DSM 10523]|uniref:Outer membrane protein n=1 Tax=Desulfocapsa sulfexigens (strain DSM 10523 / SB164P1) TaxID=1167006 RepID=M1PDL8_DESSD|nr:TolC family protein [Desulfocapsa sulfexigens]AGF77820.1 outer membrane protein [Desulfocapsa sulfexigens DSM 10523]